MSSISSVSGRLLRSPCSRALCSPTAAPITPRRRFSGSFDSLGLSVAYTPEAPQLLPSSSGTSTPSTPSLASFYPVKRQVEDQRSAHDSDGGDGYSRYEDAHSQIRPPLNDGFGRQQRQEQSPHQPQRSPARRHQPNRYLASDVPRRSIFIFRTGYVPVPGERRETEQSQHPPRPSMSQPSSPVVFNAAGSSDGDFRGAAPGYGHSGQKQGMDAQRQDQQQPLSSKQGFDAAAEMPPQMQGPQIHEGKQPEWTGGGDVHSSHIRSGVQRDTHRSESSKQREMDQLESVQKQQAMDGADVSSRQQQSQMQLETHQQRDPPRQMSSSDRASEPHRQEQRQTQMDKEGAKSWSGNQTDGLKPEEQASG